MFPPLQQVVACNGTAYHRGRQLGGLLRFSIQSLLEVKKARHAVIQTRWNDLAIKSRPLIEKYAPNTYQELVGMSDGASIPLSDILLLACEYEVDYLQTQSQKMCSAIAVSQPGCIMCGQTNDETPSAFLDGKLDVVVHMIDEQERETLIYTHPGYPAYMGMNSSGVSILWQFIDNGERNLDDGLPTCVLIREALTCSSLSEAVQYIRSVPRTVPNNFLLCSPEGCVNLETSPTRFTQLWSSEIVHTNHLLFDEAMQDKDTWVHHPESTSVARYASLRQAMKDARGRMSVELASKMLSVAPVLNDRTLATMMFAPLEGRMYIRFKGDPLDKFLVLQIKVSDDPSWVVVDSEDAWC